MTHALLLLDSRNRLIRASVSPGLSEQARQAELNCGTADADGQAGPEAIGGVGRGRGITRRYGPITAARMIEQS